MKKSCQVFSRLSTFAYSWNSLGIKRAIADARLPNPNGPAEVGRAEGTSLFLQKIASLERPRRAVLRFAGALATLFLIFIFFALRLVAYLFAAYGRDELPTSDELFPLLPLLALMVILAATIGISYRTELEKLPLIRDGQFVAARVVEQRVNHRGKQLTIKSRMSSKSPTARWFARRSATTQD
jgi:hypothetical protein